MLGILLSAPEADSSISTSRGAHLPEQLACSRSDAPENVVCGLGHIP